MTSLLAAAAGLGLAGIDPAGALIAAGALARGAAPRAVISFAVAVVAGTAVLGTVLSLTVGQGLAEVDWGSLLPKGDLAAVIELALAAALLAWGVVRVGHPRARPKRPRAQRGIGETALVGWGLLFAASAVLDPTFVGLAVIAGRDEPLLAVVVAQVTWILISQVLLVGFAVATAFGAHERVLATARRSWSRVAGPAKVALTALLFLSAAILAADALTQLFTGEFLIAPESG